MKTYQVATKETATFTYLVEANSADEAREKLLAGEYEDSKMRGCEIDEITDVRDAS